MGKGYKHGISINTPLGFSIKSYGSDTELLASVPAENTIGLIPKYTVEKWAFRVEPPEEPEVGMLWIRTAEASPFAFNALKEQEIRLYPLAATQYGAKEWVYIPAFSVKDGQWQFWWDGKLYYRGYEVSPITGGWISAAVSEDTAYKATAPTINRESTYMQAVLSGMKRSGYISTANAVDLTDYSTLQLVVSYWKLSGSSSKVTLAVVDTEDNVAASMALTGTGTYNLDVSALTGAHYVRIRIVVAPAGASTVRFTNAELL